ncbi:PfaD family polyunsaturated fatty acid/polyketide biosynthesis protein [Streptomyces sp. BP-8]|uniref:PfaD family polyunsaturated fatty acid/polyketide biosynthesis protein n=1 Tax=Streptomyces sirii TaxID=3127701 RepID=A0ABZ2QIK6_9ACTN
MIAHFDTRGVHGVLSRLDEPCYIVRSEGRIGAAHEPPPTAQLLAAAGPVAPERLAPSGFAARHGVRYPYMAGSMAGGISTEELVLALARAGHLASFGAAGLPPTRIEKAVRRLGAELPGGAWAANLIHSPMAPGAERDTVDIYLRHGVRCVEASAFVQPTLDLVRYRVAGFQSDPRIGAARPTNRVIAKVSRAETAEIFLRPPPPGLIADLAADGHITADQARWAGQTPLADDITVEADSAGHTDRRPLLAVLPLVMRLRDRLAPAVGVGAAGGISTPHSAYAAFALGASYIVTGSVNQSCVEAGTSPAVKELLAQVGIADFAMAPAADMFEMGVDVQVLKRGTMFPGRATWLYRLYRDHEGLEELSSRDRERLESQVLHGSVERTWDAVSEYLAEHRPDQLDRAVGDPKLRMALLFRWYLGLSSRWATDGDPARATDYQIWCGPAMGAFNAWTAESYLAVPAQRRVAEVADQLLRGAAYQSRISLLRLAGARLPPSCEEYRPLPDNGALPQP